MEKNKQVKNNLGIEILIGTSSRKGKLIILSNIANENLFQVRIKFDAPLFFYPGEPFIITNPGGYRILGGGKVLLPDNHTIKNKKNLKNILNHFKHFTVKEIIEFTVKIKMAITLVGLTTKYFYNPYNMDFIHRF